MLPVKRKKIVPAILLAASLLVVAQQPENARGQARDVRLTDASEVSLITILPGDQIYSLFGHTAIRVQDPGLGLDRTYNYGTFDFGNPFTFSLKFAYGDLNYFLSDASFQRVLPFYRDVARRPIVEQTLNLTLREREELFGFLQWNALPENRAYRYDFLFDNCSTRPRDAFYEHVSDLHFPAAVRDHTFRRLLDPYVTHLPWLDFGWDLLLGAPVDREAAAWEHMFLPLELMALADAATIERPSGAEPFVARTDTLFWIEGRCR